MLLDTSGLISYFDRGDARHADAVGLFQTAERRLTHNYVLAEFVAFLPAVSLLGSRSSPELPRRPASSATLGGSGCQSRGLNRAAALEFVAELSDSLEVEMHWVDEALHRAGVLLWQSRRDKTYSLCDAVSFLLMRHRNLSEAFTTDRHFEQEGFVRLLKA